MIGAFDSNDEWKLKSITVDYTPTTPVPLPAGGLLLMGGLGALVIARKFQKA
ncbi:VPLPA-CTERM sorting domain-containing protein [Roseibium album]|nr:VPLPA-CTERM sorting domain-containing protein [Roseibium album]